MQVLEDSFEKLLRHKASAMQTVINTYLKHCEAADPALQQEKKLTAQLTRLKHTRQKYLDMYTDDLISRDELNASLTKLKSEIVQAEHGLQLVAAQHAKRDERMRVLNQTFQKLSDITDLRQLTNAQLKQIVQKIEVDSAGNIDIFLRVLGEERNRL